MNNLQIDLSDSYPAVSSWYQHSKCEKSEKSASSDVEQTREDLKKRYKVKCHRAFFTPLHTPGVHWVYNFEWGVTNSLSATLHLPLTLYDHNDEV